MSNTKFLICPLAIFDPSIIFPILIINDYTVLIDQPKPYRNLFDISLLSVSPPFGDSLGFPYFYNVSRILSPLCISMAKVAIVISLGLV